MSTLYNRKRRIVAKRFLPAPYVRHVEGETPNRVPKARGCRAKRKRRKRWKW